MPFIFNNTTNSIETSANLSLTPTGTGDVSLNGRVTANRQILNVTGKSSSYTAVEGDFVSCDASGTGMTITLPGSPSADDRIGVELASVSGTATVTVARNGNTLDKASSDLVLYVPGDYVEFVFDGLTDWVVIADGIHAHYALIEADGTSSLNTGTFTQIAFNDTLEDVGGIVDLSNDEFVIRRQGWYEVFFNGVITDIDAATNVAVQFLRSTTSPTNAVQFNCHCFAAETLFGVHGAHIIRLQANETLEFWMQQSGGGTEITSTTDGLKPTAGVREIRRYYL